jgi:hypothetical protein
VFIKNMPLDLRLVNPNLPQLMTISQWFDAIDTMMIQQLALNGKID